MILKKVPGGDARNSAPVAARQVRARILARKMRGGAQADLVLTDAGWYVVKWRQNPVHRRVLINEVIGSELLQRLQIATPDWAMVQADETFLRASPGARVVKKETYIQVETGWHFGSKVPVNILEKAIYDFLPASCMIRVTNFHDFLRVLVFDLWVDNCDGRQAIFFGEPGRRFAAQMIDHTFAFGFDGADWRMRDRVGKDRYSLVNCYLAPENNEQFESTIVDIEGIVRTDFECVRKSVPGAWIENDGDEVDRLFDELRSRSRRLADLLALAKTELGRGHLRSTQADNG